jgi:phosphonate transport system substrate-binding protein
VAPVLAGERYGGRPIYFSDVIVRAEDPARSFADLRGRSWAYNERASQSGYGIVRHTLIAMGETRGFFGRVVESGAHQRSIRMVVDGEADAAAIDSQVLAVEFRDHPELRERLRLIAALGPSTIQPLVASCALPAGTRETVRAILLRMHEDPAMRAALEAGFIERFVAVGPSDYDDIRTMLQAAEDAHFLVVR